MLVFSTRFANKMTKPCFSFEFWSDLCCSNWEKLEESEQYVAEQQWISNETFLELLQFDRNCIDAFKWLWKLKEKYQLPIDLTADDNLIFRLAARNGHLEILKWLWSLRQNYQIAIDPTANDNYAFRNAAKNGYLEVLKWLWSLRQDFQVEIDPTAGRNYVFRRVPLGKVLHKWLWSLNVCHSLSLYLLFLDCTLYSFKSIKEGWLLRIPTPKNADNLIVENLMKCEDTKRVFGMFLIYLNRKKIYFGVEMSEMICKKILLHALPKMISQ